MAEDMDSGRWRRLVFWVGLVGFVAWDLHHAPPINLRLEPPLIAAGSGQAAAGGHCSMAK
jgi:hypothetical protein